MPTTKKSQQQSAAKPDGFSAPKLPIVTAKMKLDDARKLVREQNSGFLRGEETLRDYAWRLSYNNFSVYLRALAETDPKKTVNEWLEIANINPKEVRTTRIAKRVALALWQDDDDGRRSSEQANVLEAAKRYFEKTASGKTPALAAYLAWVDECGGLNEIRRGRISVELGGKTKTAAAKPKTSAEVFEERAKSVRESASFGTINYAPEDAAENEIVVFYGVVTDGKTSLRLACRIPDDDTGAKNLHSLAPAKIVTEGQEVIPHSMGENVTLVSGKEVRTADDVLTAAAEQSH